MFRDFVEVIDTSALEHKRATSLYHCSSSLWLLFVAGVSERSAWKVAFFKDVAWLRFVQEDAGGPNGTRSRSRGVAVDHEAAEHVIHFLCVENPAGFEQWVQPNHPDVASDAIRDMLTTRSVGKLQALGRRYVEYSNGQLARTIQRRGHGS